MGWLGHNTHCVRCAVRDGCAQTKVGQPLEYYIKIKDVFLQEKEFAEMCNLFNSLGLQDLVIKEKKQLQAVYKLVQHASQNDKLTKADANNDEDQMSAKKNQNKVIASSSSQYTLHIRPNCVFLYSVDCNT